MTPDLGIVIVNWNGGELLRRAVASLVRAPPSVPWALIVVDNASSDDSVAWMRSADARALVGATPLHVIENAENAGFSRAANQGIAHGRAPLLFLLNADAEVRAGAIDALIATARSGARIAACGPRLVNTDGSLQYSVWPNPPTPIAILAADLGLWRLIPRRARGEWLLGRHWPHARRRDVPMLFGAALLVTRAALDEIGGFDERFHMYAEDTEWCLRATRAGWRLIFEPGATVVHHGGRFSLRRWGGAQKQRVQLESFFQFQRFCLSRGHRLANLAATCVVLASHRAWRTLRREPAPGNADDDTAMALRLHVADLKRTWRER